MMLPDTLRSAISNKLGVSIEDVQRCSGGDINQAVRINTLQGSFFVKWHRQSPPRMFSTEAKGLAILRKAEKLRIPNVVAVEESTDDHPAYLVLEWLESGRSTPQTDEQLGVGLAALHQFEAPQHGLDHDNFIGKLPQYNTHYDSWISFYAEQRIQPQMEIARQKGRLPSDREKRLKKLIKRLPDILPDAPPSLLHGDLWRGNVMVLEGGEPAIIDPAVYYGHREVEMAFTELFGGFSQRFYDAYNAVYPLDKGYPERRALYQLYPLMVHMNLFGGGYGGRVNAIARQYIG